MNREMFEEAEKPPTIQRWPNYKTPSSTACSQIFRYGSAMAAISFTASCPMGMTPTAASLTCAYCCAIPKVASTAAVPCTVIPADQPFASHEALGSLGGVFDQDDAKSASGTKGHEELSDRQGHSRQLSGKPDPAFASNDRQVHQLDQESRIEVRIWPKNANRIAQVVCCS